MGHASPLKVVFCERFLGKIVDHYLLQTSETGSEKKGDQPLVRRWEVNYTGGQFYTQVEVKGVNVGKLIHDSL